MKPALASRAAGRSARHTTRRTALAGIAAVAAGALWPACAPAQAKPARPAPPEVGSELPAARLLGQGRLTYLSFSVYRARLWVGDGFEPAQFERHPLALELIYERNLSGKLIAERSLVEMKRTGAVDAALAARWLASMTELFPDVREGDRLTGVQRPGQSVAFFANGRATGELRDADFARRFFSIWLAPSSSAPRLREQLLGSAPAGA
jgi:hypothetical protein